MSEIKYDIIGDIHGYSNTLVTMFNKLGYKFGGDCYRHPERKIIFLGDFIDRGPHQREVIELVRPMIENGAALSVMGNHEFNSIAYFTQDPESGDYLRKHIDKNKAQHQTFLDAYANAPEYEDVIRWFRSLPLWLELDYLNVVHACWDREWIKKIKLVQGYNFLGTELLVMASKKGKWEYEAVETLLKGKVVPLKEGISFKDNDGNYHHNIRVRWWDQEATTYQKTFMGPESARTHIPDDEIEGDHLVEYSHNDPPLFLGHYWMEGRPKRLAENIACLDYSVAIPGGKLVAYRWNGERVLKDENFVSVDRIEPTF